MALAEDISQQPSIDCVMWLLLIENKNQACEARRNTKIYSLRRKRPSSKGNIRAKPCAQGNKVFKDPILLSLILNRKGGVVTSGQDPTQLSY